MLVTPTTFQAVVEKLKNNEYLSIDTETTGLNAYGGDELFSIIIHSDHGTYYFNYNPLHPEPLARSDIRKLTEPLSTAGRVFMANAKFDMHFLAKEGVEVGSTVIDILVADKLLSNTHMSYSLASVAERYGYKKLDVVKDYIKEHKIYDENKNPMYHKVPWEIMEIYAETDAQITYEIGKKIKSLLDSKKENKKFHSMCRMEWKVTKACFEIERRGMAIDEEFIKRAITHEEGEIAKAEADFRDLTGTEFVDSNKSLSQIFNKLNIKGGVTEKGNPSFTEAVLSKIDHPVASVILRHRSSTKRCNTYFKNFLSMSNEGVVHPNIRQAGADTFRFSVTNPALQTLNAEEEGDFKVRDSFKARDGFYLVAIDYQAQEYRLAVDLSNEQKQLKNILKGGDVHQATADMVGISRKPAKVLNFALLYGASYKKIAGMIGVKDTESKVMVEKYFHALPNLARFLKDTVRKAEANKMVVNWSGRELRFPKPEFAYKAPNYLIQSSGADIMRHALVELTDFLKPYKSKIVMSIHDEILFEVAEDELFLIEKFREIMVRVYPPQNGLPMDTSVEIGRSWGSLGEYYGDKARDVVSQEASRRVENDPENRSVFDSATGDSGDTRSSYQL